MEDDKELEKLLLAIDGDTPEIIALRRKAYKDALIAWRSRAEQAARIDELREAAYHIEGWDKYALGRYAELTKEEGALDGS